VDAVIIYNPAAGRAIRKQQQFSQAVATFAAAGWHTRVAATGGEGEAIDLARAAVDSGADVVVAAGGDGTVNEVVQALAHKPVRLGVLPLGTVNVWAREAGFSTRIDQAARDLVTGRNVALDLGRVGDRFFLLMAGVGLDAEVTAALGTAKMQKQKLGIVPYLMRIATVVPRYRGASIEIEMDGRIDRHDALMVLVANTRLYAGVRRPIRNAVANDGMLDIRIFHGRGPAHSIRHLIRFLLERQGSADAGDLLRAQSIVVRATPPLAVQVDGDPIGTTPVEISVERHALRAIVPAGYDKTLISSDHA
jgi:diacylglycerol kinase (ATP)